MDLKGILCPLCPSLCCIFLPAFQDNDNTTRLLQDQEIDLYLISKCSVKYNTVPSFNTNLYSFNNWEVWLWVSECCCDLSGWRRWMMISCLVPPLTRLLAPQSWQMREFVFCVSIYPESRWSQRVNLSWTINLHDRDDEVFCSSNPSTNDIPFVTSNAVYSKQ